MSIIQQLRDRAAVLLTTLIALSLIGFLVQDAFIGRSSGLFSGPSKTAGSVNGEDIDAVDFNEKVRVLEESNRQQGMASNEMMTQNIIESVWNNFIQETLIRTEAEKLGISFTPKEMSELLFSEDAPQEFKQLFTDQNTGQFNIQAARNWFSNIKKSKNAEEQKMVNNQLIEPLVIRQLGEKYTSLLGQGSYVPKWLVEKMNADNSQFASISIVGVPYAMINDSTVKVSDDEIKEYTKAHQEEFKQDKSRSIAYVVFDASPSSADSQAVFNRLVQLKEEFKVTPDPRSFVVRNGSTIPFFDGFVVKSRMAMSYKDSIINAPMGTVAGPYLDANTYVIVKKLETRKVPDSVKVRHILIGTNDPATGAVKRTDEAAKKLADSLFTAIKSGSPFALLAATLSDDQGSKNNGGEYQFSSLSLGTLAKEFGEYAFYKNTGSSDVIKTSFGYHIIEVLEQKNFEDAYKIAYVSKPILSSQETDAKASSAATQFAGNSRDFKSFEENVTKGNLTKRVADGIKEIDHNVSGMPSRSFVKWIWDNKIGDVSEPVDFKDKYVVAVITGNFEEGVQPPQVARVMAEPIIRNQKKAELLRKKIGNAASLEAVASANGQQIQNIDTLRFSEAFIPNLGPEAKVLGAAFNKANQSKVSEPIEGQSGLFFIKTKQIGALANLGVNVEAQQKAMQGQLKQYSSYSSFESLKKAAKIEDNRRAAGF